MSQVKTVEQLRAILPPPRETTKAKILPFLDEQAIDFPPGTVCAQATPGKNCSKTWRYR